MDTTQWAQRLGFMNNQMGEDQLLVPSSITTNSTATRSAVPPISQQLVAESKAAAARPPPQKEQAALHCPRCKSSNTKFCYYNNYSLTQPRYICKACRRYWTEGGSLRNVPVGGGSRKNKRHSSAFTANSAAIPSSKIKNHQIPSSLELSNIKNHQIPSSLQPSSFPTGTSKAFNQVDDLNLAYPNYNHNYDFLNNNINNSNGSVSSGISHMELLRSTTRGLGPLMPMHMPMTSMAPGQESSGAGVLHAAGLFPFDGSTVGSGVQEGGRRLMFPFGSDLKQEQHRGHGGDQEPMFWNSMMDGGAGAGAGAGSW